MSVTLLEGFDRLVREIRAGFHDLAELGNSLHAAEGVTTAMRGVMEHVVEKGPCTVPDIARAKSVTRQHIQQLADALVAADYCEYRPNPAHKRSPLVATTESGKHAFARMKAREKEVVATRISEFDPQDLVDAATTISRLRTALAKKEDQT